MIELVLFALAGALAYLTQVDRASAVALTVVEWEQALGVPLFLIAGGLGAAALVRRVVRLARAPARTAARPVTRPDAPRRASPSFDGGDWRSSVRARADALPLGPQDRLRTDEAPGVAFTLVLVAATPEQTRRRTAVFAEFLASIPTPPGARVRLESSPDVEQPVHTLLMAALGRQFPGGSFHVTRLADGADVRFVSPDPRWGRAV